MKIELSNKFKMRYVVAFAFLIICSVLNSCKKTDNFYEKLKALPQIDNTNDHAYKLAYIIGDTMVVTGKLYPKNNLQISIGGQTADIVKTDSVKNNYSIWLDRVSFLITDQMVGKAKEVKITSGGYSTLGASIDVFTPGGPGSFDRSLKSGVLKSFTGGEQNVFLHCQNGKGDIYYYSASQKDLRHIKKDGTETILYNLSGTPGAIGAPITDFVAGGVDPQGQQLYFSARSAPSSYVFCKVDLSTNQLTVLNRSQDTSAPYEGAVGSVKMAISGIYPNSKGDVYLAIGFNLRDFILPDAIARYSAADGKVNYIYKKLIAKNNFPGMPGTDISFSNIPVSFRFSPDENLMYVQQQSSGVPTIEVYDLDTRIKLHSLTSKPGNGLSRLDVIAPFSSLHIGLAFADANESFGFMPMPGKRLQVLFYQTLDGGFIGQQGTDLAGQFGFPKWIVLDFTAQRTYAYAPGRFDQHNGTYIFGINDELLNYDEAGNLYATSNEKAFLLKTQAQ